MSPPSFFLQSFGVIRCRTVWTTYGKNFSLVNWNKGHLRSNIPSKTTRFFTYKKPLTFSCFCSWLSKVWLKDIEMMHSCRISIALSNKTKPEPKARSFAEISDFSRNRRNWSFAQNRKTGHFSARALTPHRNIQKLWYFGYEILVLDPTKWYEKDPNWWIHGGRSACILGGFTMNPLLSRITGVLLEHKRVLDIDRKAQTRKFDLKFWL